jgi:hypothetical protein
MGSWAEVVVRGKSVVSFKNEIEPTFLLLFVREDFRERLVPDEDPPERLQLATTAGALRDRLDALGIGRDLVADAFENLKAQKLDSLTGIEERLDLTEDISEALRAEVVLLEGLNYMAWTESLCRVLDEPEDRSWQTTLGISRMKVGSIGWLLGLWEWADPRFVLRAALEGLSASEDVVLDVTDLLDGGWIERDLDPPCAGPAARWRWRKPSRSWRLRRRPSSRARCSRSTVASRCRGMPTRPARPGSAPRRGVSRVGAAPDG